MATVKTSEVEPKPQIQFCFSANRKPALEQLSSQQMDSGLQPGLEPGFGQRLCNPHSCFGLVQKKWDELFFLKGRARENRFILWRMGSSLDKEVTGDESCSRGMLWNVSSEVLIFEESLISLLCLAWLFQETVVGNSSCVFPSVL